MANNNQKPLNNAEEIIERFGGIRPMSNKTDIPVTTIQGWKKRNAIPATRTEEILKAAADNNISLGDLTGNGANENSASAVQKEPVTDAHTAEREVVTEDFTAERAPEFLEQSRDNDHEKPVYGEKEFEQILAQVEKRAVSRSVVMAVLVLGVILGVIAYILWPEYQNMNVRVSSMQAVEQDLMQLEEQVANVETTVQDVQEEQGFLRGMVPENWEAEIESLRAQADGLMQRGADLRDQAGAVMQKAEEVYGDVVAAPDATIDQRMAALQMHMNEMGASEALNGFMGRMMQLQSTVAGNDVLNNTMSQLSALTETASNSGQDVGVLLDQARQSSSAMGQTFDGVPPEEMKAAAMLFTMNQFRAALNRDNESFAEDLEILKNLSGSENPEFLAALDRLAPHAESGVLTMEGLSNEFRSVAGEAVAASLKGEDVSFQERASARMNEIFSVEKSGELVTGTPTQAALAESEKLLQNGQLEEAIATVEGLDGPAREAMQPWIDEARIRLMAEQVKNTVGDVMSGNLSGLGGSFIQYPEADMYLYVPKGGGNRPVAPAMLQGGAGR